MIAGLKVDPALLGPARGERCVAAECRSACCRNGIWMSREHADRIRAHAGDVAPLLPEDRRSSELWFDPDEGEDPDFPGGVAVGSATLDDPDDPDATVCAFLRPDRLCALQVASTALGLPGTGLKPRDCALYPVLVSQGEVVLDRWSPGELGGADCQRACAGAPPPVYQVFREELELALGREGWEELRRLTRGG